MFQGSKKQRIRKLSKLNGNRITGTYRIPAMPGTKSK